MTSAVDAPTLNSIIRSVVETTNEPNPRVIAEMVVDRVPQHMLRPFFAESVIDHVRTALRARRNLSMDVTRETHRAQSARSAKVTAVRDWWVEFCNAPVHIGKQQWKVLGECGEAELAFAAEERREHAKNVLTQADRFDHLRALVVRYGVATVSELPESARDEVRA